MALRPMHDLIIFLPGIMGSVLTKNGRALWSLSPRAVSRVLQFKQLVSDLMLDGDDPHLPALDDGVLATELMPDAHLIPGFWKIDGYTALIDALRSQFNVKLGTIHAPEDDANLFPFPYDWRRDNRANARRLATFVERQLAAWRTASGNMTAQVILIAHSMGGLISRYYLECLGGHEQCRALITFGTPYRGSLNALNAIANGKRILRFFDVSSALRSFTSVYQLLPTYPVIKTDAGYMGVTETQGIEHLDLQRANDALNLFYRPMEEAATTRAQAGLSLPYRSILIIGTNQPTKQSAVLDSSAVAVSEEMPKISRAQALPGYGDSTVPFYSALPAGTRAFDHALHFGIENHSALQCNQHLQQQLLETLHILQAGGDILGAESFAVGAKPGLRLLLDDVYPPEGGMIRVEPVDIADDLGDLLVRLTALDDQRPTGERRIPFADGAWRLELERPTPGMYRISAELDRGGSGAVSPIQDLFAVAAAPML